MLQYTIYNPSVYYIQSISILFTMLQYTIYHVPVYYLQCFTILLTMFHKHSYNILQSCSLQCFTRPLLRVSTRHDATMFPHYAGNDPVGTITLWERLPCGNDPVRTILWGGPLSGMGRHNNNCIVYVTVRLHRIIYERQLHFPLALCYDRHGMEMEL